RGRGGRVDAGAGCLEAREGGVRRSRRAHDRAERGRRSTRAVVHAAQGRPGEGRAVRRRGTAGGGAVRRPGERGPHHAVLGGGRLAARGRLLRPPDGERRPAGEADRRAGPVSGSESVVRITPGGLEAPGGLRYWMPPKLPARVPRSA